MCNFLSIYFAIFSLFSNSANGYFISLTSTKKMDFVKIVMLFVKLISW